MSRVYIIRTALLCAVLVSIMGQCFGQDDCEESIDKKTQKYIDGATNKKNDLKKRFDLMKLAVENDENCLRCKLMLGEFYFKRAERNPRISYSSALTQFKELESLCPDYHADLFYYLGVIYYGQEEWSKSKEAFEKFQNFPVDDPTKISKGHEKKMVDVGDVLDEVEFNADLFENPIEFNPIRIEGVSSSSDEYLPVLSPDNETMFYTRKYQKDGKSVLDKYEVEEFTWSKRSAIGSPFDKGKALPSPFNVGDNYGGATISVNNKEMYVTVCRPGKQGYNNCDIYVSRYSKSYNEATGQEELLWSELENLGPNVNTDDGWESQPSLSADGRTLYFATARATSTDNNSGGKSIDIFYTTKDQNGNWGKAKGLGQTINGPGNEKSPFMHGDSRTLYFSADGLPGVGGYDIYFSKLSDNGKWSKPRNIGVPINTTQDEHGLIVATDGTLAYYASSKIQGAKGFDIYGFELPDAAKPEKVLLVKGSVKDDAGQLVEDARIELNYLESKRVDRIAIDQEDGSYATIVNVEREPVVMTIESEEHAFKAQLFNEEKAAKGLVAEVDIELKEVSIGQTYAIDDIKYATSSSDISEGSKAVLTMFAAYLNKNQSLKIAIHGHTDNVGKTADNLTLSTERAFEVMKYLQEQGVPAESMSFKGFGSSKPVADNATAEGKAKNRRTEFVVTAD